MQNGSSSSSSSSRSRSRRRRSSQDSEDEELRPVEEESSSNKLSWKNCFSLLLNQTEQETSSVRNGSGRGITVAAAPTVSHQSPPRFVIHPDNWYYLAWTQFILIWAVYSSFFTPLEFGFFRGLPQDLFLLDIAGQLAFLIDIVVCFFVAYRDVHSYRIVYNRNLIALRYLKSRFMVDLLGCFPWDAIYKASGRKEPVRYLLWIRLSRAVRVTEYFEKLEKDIRINYLFIRIVKLLVVELYCTHTAACTFYYLATTLPPSEEGYTWIGSLKMGDYSYAHFREIDLWTRYITSLYFAIVTMATVGYGEIHAVNTREMIFVMCYLSFDMILGAYLLGNMTALIVKGSNTERFRDKMEDIIKFLNRHKLGKNISKEIQRHVRLQYERSYTVASVLHDIPVSTRAKISQKLYEPFLREVPLFRGCSVKFIKQIAIKAHEEFCLPGQVIVEQGSLVDQLYFICHGKLEEVKTYEDNETGEPVLSLETYSSFDEIYVLCDIPVPWTVRASELSRLLRIDKQDFTGIIEMYFLDGRIIINNMLEGRDSDMQKKILESDIILNIRTHESELAMRLNSAANDGDVYRVKCFIGVGADPNWKDYDGRSPLHLAASNGHEDVTRFLLQEGAEINIKDKFGNTPLLEAINNGHDQVVSLLVNVGASLTVDSAGNCLCEVVARRDADLLRRLLACGINPNYKNYDCRTPLHLAAAEGLYTISASLLEAGASVFTTDRWGRTPLDEARVGGNKALVKILEDAKEAQSSGYHSERSQAMTDKMRRRKCTVFPLHSWDQITERRIGAVLWVPESIEDLIKAAKEELKFSEATCILSESRGKILDVDMISDDEILLLASESP